jgi:hypothetical protein
MPTDLGPVQPVAAVVCLMYEKRGFEVCMDAGA